MADDFNTGDMLSVYLFENQQLLENLQNIVMEQKDADGFDEDSINERDPLLCTGSRADRGQE